MDSTWMSSALDTAFKMARSSGPKDQTPEEAAAEAAARAAAKVRKSAIATKITELKNKTS